MCFQANQTGAWENIILDTALRAAQTRKISIKQTHPSKQFARRQFNNISKQTLLNCTQPTHDNKEL